MAEKLDKTAVACSLLLFAEQPLSPVKFNAGIYLLSRSFPEVAECFGINDEVQS